MKMDPRFRLWNTAFPPTFSSQMLIIIFPLDLLDRHAGSKQTDEFQFELAASGGVLTVRDRR